MSRDPIIDEVRAIRDSIAREHNYDLDAVFRMLQQAEIDSIPGALTSRRNRRKSRRSRLQPNLALQQSEGSSGY